MQVARGNVFSIVRQPIRIQGVATQVATVGGRRVGVIKVRSFASTTMHDVATALQTVNK